VPVIPLYFPALHVSRAAYSFGDAVLNNCTIAGTLINIVFYGPEAPAGWQTRLINVDFSGAKLVDTDFRCGLSRDDAIEPQINTDEYGFKPGKRPAPPTG
jgi:hypothetical protein